MKDKKIKKSGPAIFMYCVIAITVITSIICFYLYINYKQWWFNEIISLSTLLFIIPWSDGVWAFLISAIVAMIFDSQFIIIQRYNRPRIVKILEREKVEKKKNTIC